MFNLKFTLKKSRSDNLSVCISAVRFLQFSLICWIVYSMFRHSVLRSGQQGAPLRVKTITESVTWWLTPVWRSCPFSTASPRQAGQSTSRINPHLHNTNHVIATQTRSFIFHRERALSNRDADKPQENSFFLQRWHHFLLIWHSFFSDTHLFRYTKMRGQYSVGCRSAGRSQWPQLAAQK